jgi:Protein of unknown function (DUF2721)
MSLTQQLSQPGVLAAMLAPALLMAATGSLLVSANARLARVVDRLRGLVITWEVDAPDRAEREVQIERHRTRARLVLNACRLLYAALACFVGTGLCLAADALFGSTLAAAATVVGMLGMICLLGASIVMGREVGLSVASFDQELDAELAQKRG